MSLYAEYLKERLGDDVVEVDEGFATYRFIEEGRTVYIVDVYVKPEARRYGHASLLADVIADIARKKGCTSMIGTVQPTARGSTESIKALLGYGMRLEAAQNDAIIMRKDI